MDPSLVTKLEPYLLMAKSARGAAAAKLVQDATSASGVYVFSELLEMPSIAEVISTLPPVAPTTPCHANARSFPLPKLRQSETHAQYHALLELFAYHTYPDYKEKKDALPALSPAQASKLKHLSLVSFAMQSRILPYAPLLAALDLPSVHALESLIIDALYSDLIRGKLDQNKQQFEVEYTIGRDIPHEALGSLLGALEDWASTTSSILSTLDSKLGALSSMSAAAAREANAHDATLHANLKEVLDKREKTKRSGDLRARENAKESGSLRVWKDRDEDMDVDEPTGSGAKGKNRKASQEIPGKTRSKRNRT
ncbi:hypothetical protein OF83DRAFT_1099364 [Amylostereum chailletii]|nr:hypothetical protein OF83DRAFT_1099364 [Amylostereum chailletii]